MKRLLVLAICCCLSVAASGKTGRLGGGTGPNATLAGFTVYALTAAGHLVTFNSGAPQSLLTNVAITGLSLGDAPLGIDFRPSSEGLYLLTTNRLYVLDVDTGVATAVGGAFTTGLNGTAFGVDFNPVVDRLRVVSNNQQNLRLNPDTGAVENIDTPLQFAAGDPHFGAAPQVCGSAYTNNVPNAGSTTLYDIDFALDILVTQNPANNGTLTTVGGLGVDTTDRVGFDIRTSGGIAYASLTATGATFSSFYTIDLGTGLATLVGNIGGLSQILDIAIPIGLQRGTDTAGVYDPSTSTFLLRNSNTPGAADITFSYGAAGLGYVPLTGDWDGDGIDTPGVYNPATGAFFLRNSNSAGPADVTFVFGAAGAGYVPLAGDWNGDGIDTIGLYNPSTGAFFLKNTNAGGVSNISFIYGGVGLGYVPLAGDWNGDGVDSIGLYRPSTGFFFLRNANSSGPADVVFGYGAPNSTPLRGDYDNDGVTTAGIYVSATGAFFLKNVNGPGAADLTFIYGAPGLTPLVGDWDGH